MNLKLLRILLVSILLVSTGFLSLSAQVIKLYDGSQTAETPFVLVMKNGDIMVMFTEGYHINADCELRYTIYNKTTGWAPIRTPVAKKFSSAFPQAVLDKDGDIHLAYMDGNSWQNRDIRYAMFSNGQWGSSHLAYENNNVNDSWPKIRVEDDLIYIAWSYNYPSEVGEMDLVMVANRKGGSWPVAKALRETISDSYRAVSVHGDFDVRNKSIYAAWMDTNHAIGSGLWSIYYNEGIYNPTTNRWDWKSPVRLFPTSDAQYFPSVGVDPGGSPHIVYSNKLGPFLHTRKTAAGWTGPTAISANPTGFNSLIQVVFKHGLLHTVWREGTAAGESVFYGRALPDGRWAKSIKVADGFHPQYFSLDIDAQGNAHVVWSDGPDDHTRDVYYAKVNIPGAAPQAVIEASPKLGNIPLTVNFDASKSTDSDGQIVDYLWEFGDGSKASGPKVSYTYRTKGRYTATLTVIDNDFRSGTSQTEIITSEGEPLASFTTSTTKGMIPLTVNFDASASIDVDGTIVSYSWNFGDGGTGGGKTVIYTYTKGGIFTVTLTVTDNVGKTGTASTKITVFQKPVAKFTATPTYGILPLKVNFDASASSDPDGSIVSYNWDFGNGTTGQGKTISHTFSSGGKFLVILTVTDNDSYTGTAVQWIEALDRPAAPLNVKVERVLNKGLTSVEHINNITWQDNPRNTGAFTIAKYKIYRKPKGMGDDKFGFLGETPASVLQYYDRKFLNAAEADGFEYAVTAVDDKGKESELGKIGSSGSAATITGRLPK